MNQFTCLKICKPDFGSFLGRPDRGVFLIGDSRSRFNSIILAQGESHFLEGIQACALLQDCWAIECENPVFNIPRPREGHGQRRRGGDTFGRFARKSRARSPASTRGIRSTAARVRHLRQVCAKTLRSATRVHARDTVNGGTGETHFDTPFSVAVRRLRQVYAIFTQCPRLLTGTLCHFALDWRCFMISLPISRTDFFGRSFLRSRV